MRAANAERRSPFQKTKKKYIRAFRSAACRRDGGESIGEVAHALRGRIVSMNSCATFPIIFIIIIIIREYCISFATSTNGRVCFFFLCLQARKRTACQCAHLVSCTCRCAASGRVSALCKRFRFFFQSRPDCTQVCAAGGKLQFALHYHLCATALQKQCTEGRNARTLAQIPSNSVHITRPRSRSLRA